MGSETNGTREGKSEGETPMPYKIYSETSLNRPFTVENSCGPFREVTVIHNFPRYSKDVVFLILVTWPIYGSICSVGRCGRSHCPDNQRS